MNDPLPQATQERFKFSNFSRLIVPITFQGISYYTVENFYQAMKSLDPEFHLACSKASPGQSKKMGRTIAIRADWNQIKDDVMLYALREKFAHDPWKTELLQHAGPLVEYNYWHDNYWGHCTCSQCRDVEHHNKLGKLIEQVKQEITKP